MPKHKSKRERVTFKVQATDKDDYGHLKSKGWFDHPDLVNIPATWEHTAGMENFRGRQLETNVIGVFEIRTQPKSVVSTMRLVHVNDSNKNYGIVSVRPAEGKFEGGFRHLWVFVRSLE